MSLALARKYRPRRFADVAVQSHVAVTLRNAIANDRVAQAYLFAGPRGTGKTTLARVLAMALNCENKRADHEPCGECGSCTRIWAGFASLDVVEIDAASNRGVDDARDLRERAMYAPSGENRHKVYIIDEAHMLTREAWNALLKILEEPPPRVVFVFATTEPQKIAQTAAPVLSRVQRFDLKRIGPRDVRDRLTAVFAAEGIGASADALAMLARAADGSMRDALSLADQVLSLGGGELTTQHVRDALGMVHDDEFVALLDMIAAHQASDVFDKVGRLADTGMDLGLLLAGLADVLRAQLAVQLGGGMPDLSEQLREKLESRKERIHAGDLLRMLTLLVDLEPHFRRSAQQQLLLEILLVRFTLLDRTVAIEDILRGLDRDDGPVRPAERPSSGISGGAVGTGVPTARRVSESRRAEPSMVALSTRLAPGPSTAAPAVIPAPPTSRRSADESGEQPKATMADQSIPKQSRRTLDLNRLAEHWDDVIEFVRAGGRGMVASALAEATPVAVTGAGVVTITVAGDALAEAIQSGNDAVMAALRTVFEGVRKVVVNAVSESPGSAPRRLTAEFVIADRLAMLRKRDPLLGDAIDALDLRLIE